MEIKALHHYQKGVDAVFKFFSDPDAIKTKYEGIGARNVEILESSEQGSTLNLKSQREVPADVPGILKKFLGAWNTVVQTDNWQVQDDGVRACKMGINVVSVPVTVTGTLTLRPSDAGCTNEVYINVTCGIPFIGGVLADFVGGTIKNSADAEYEYIGSHL